MTNPLTLEELDGLVKTYVAARQAYDAQRAISNEREKEKYKAEQDLLSALKAADKKTYRVEGVGSISRREKFAVRVPNGDQKRAFLEYLQKRGEDVFYNLVTVNYNTLNGFYASEMEAAEAEGVFPFVIPGLEDPILTEGITFREEKANGNTKATKSSRGKGAAQSGGSSGYDESF